VSKRGVLVSSGWQGAAVLPDVYIPGANNDV